MFEIRHYLTTDCKDLINIWLRKLRDVRAKTRIIQRLNRMEQVDILPALKDGEDVK